MAGVSKSVDENNLRIENAKYQTVTPYVTEELNTDDIYQSTCEIAYKPPKANHEYEREFDNVEKQIKRVMGHISHVPTEYNFQGYGRPLSPVYVHKVLSPDSKINKSRLGHQTSSTQQRKEEETKQVEQETAEIEKQIKEETRDFPYRRPKYGKTKSREFGSPTYKWKDNATTSFPVELPPEPQPKPWTGDNPFSYKNQLGCPSISYDLIGDGVVSSKEYFIAKLFDKENKGYLNENERKAAMNAFKNGIENKYIFSANGVRKATENDIKSRNGGWMKYDALGNHPNTRTKLLDKRKKSMKEEAHSKAMRYFKHLKEQELPPDIPFVGTLDKQLESKQLSKTRTNSIDDETFATFDYNPSIDNEANKENINTNIKNNENNENESETITKENTFYIENPKFKSRSDLVNQRQIELMKSLEKSRMEAEKYFMPVKFRKLDFQQKFLHKRNEHKSKRTLQELKQERLHEHQQKGRFWENRTNFETFNARAKEKEFWQNAVKENEKIYKNETRKNSQISNELYNRMKYSNKKDENKIPLPFECETDNLKWNRDPRYKSIIKQELIELRNKELKDSGITKIIDTKIKYQKPNYCEKIPYIKPKRENFEEFADKINQSPSNLIVLFGSRKASDDECPPNQWHQTKLASYLEKHPMYSSFSEDGIFREPQYTVAKKKKVKKDNIFRDVVTRPKTEGTLYYIPPQSINVKYKDMSSIENDNIYNDDYNEHNKTRKYTSEINVENMNNPTQTQDIMMVPTHSNKKLNHHRSTSFLKNQKIYKHDKLNYQANYKDSILHRLKHSDSLDQTQFHDSNKNNHSRLPVRTSAFPQSQEYSQPMRPVTSYALSLSPQYRKIPRVC